MISSCPCSDLHDRGKASIRSPFPAIARKAAAACPCALARQSVWDPLRGIQAVENARAKGPRVQDGGRHMAVELAAGSGRAPYCGATTSISNEPDFGIGRPAG